MAVSTSVLFSIVYNQFPVQNLAYRKFSINISFNVTPYVSSMSSCVASKFWNPLSICILAAVTMLYQVVYAYICI